MTRVACQRIAWLSGQSLSRRPARRRWRALSSYVGDSATGSPLRMHATFLRHPTPAIAAKLALHDDDPVRVWSAFEHVLQSGCPVDVRLFHPMMQFCRRVQPHKAADVLRVAGRRQVPITEALFCTFLSACKAANPPPVQEAVDLYKECGPRTPIAVFGVFDLCRASKQPALAIPLLSHAIASDVAFTKKLVTIVAACCAESGCPAGADAAEQMLDLFRSNRAPHDAGQPTFFNLIKALLQQKRFGLAVSTLTLMHDTFGLAPTESTYNRVLFAVSKHAHISVALSLFNTMLQRNAPVDVRVFTSLIEACGRCSNLSGVQALHEHARARSLLHDDFVVSALVASYGHCSNLVGARAAFEDRCAAFTPDAAVFNSMMTAYAHQGLLDDAVGVYERLKAVNLRPTRSTLVALLTGCCRAGDTARAYAFLSEFATVWNVAADYQHVNIMIDMHGRLGDLNAAEKLASSSPAAGVISWNMVLAACVKHRDLDRAERAFSAIVSRSDAGTQDLASAYVSMSNMYYRAGRQADVARLRHEVRTRGIVKASGQTSLQLADCCLDFSSNDRRLRNDRDLAAMHASMMNQLVEHGYIPDLSYVTRSARTDDEARRAVYGHSEKIAVAHALRSVPPGEPIRLAKNLRVCPDCHEAIKHVSVVFAREVFVRDSTRHHHFRDGKCSCEDFW
ncbi:DYW domain-containing protein [Plasmodiophora brassicae]|uniref:DYW domain-containing protein n=1 Tax=Plasmodiophora brassicae TaxID=37360 RepID=A0A0G4IXZ5_PLABS|nr:hypothetical protein PBRA_007680 [Plasmodiophora brassicae]SPQ99576.1 unnamed protein product [Plasmodiophora brassicae]